MSQRLKRWESPRKEGRNDKGKGGSARQRQLKKRTQMLRNKLKDQSNNDGNKGRSKKGENHDSLLFYWLFSAISSRYSLHEHSLRFLPKTTCHTKSSWQMQ
jgi:hypothetical protein